MPAAFRNFFLSFIICLLLFGFVGYCYAWPLISDMLSLESMGGNEESKTVSGTEESRPDDVDTPSPVSGKTLTCVFIGETIDGEVGSIIFFRANEGSRRFTCTSIPLDTKMTNEVGVDVPISVLLENAGLTSVKQRISALTGFEVQYSVRVGFDGIRSLLEKLRNPYFDLSRPITCVNPIYKSVTFAPGSEPDDYYLSIAASRQPLNATITEALLSYNPYTDGTDYLVLTGELYQSLFVQFMTNSGTKRNLKNLSELLPSVDTDITINVIEANLDIAFTYDEYSLQSVNYPNEWTKAIAALRSADTGR